MTYEKLPVWQFGQRLLDTLDLDPVYVGLAGAGLPRPQLCRWLVAYWCFYHVGSASWLSEQEGNHYWTWVVRAAENVPLNPAPVGGRWPRSPERRHFRGAKCVNAVEALWKLDALAAVENLATYADKAEFVMGVVQTWPLHGPWIAFKAADMLERCVPGCQLKFPDDLGLVYSEPRSALDILAARRDPSEDTRAPRDAEYWWRQLLLRFSHTPAPPVARGGRNCGPQEVETVLCKWKSHDRGHYPVGKDTREVRHALVGWGETADRLLAHMPPEVPS